MGLILFCYRMLRKEFIKTGRIVHRVHVGVAGRDELGDGATLAVQVPLIYR